MGHRSITRALAALILIAACNPSDAGPDASSEHFDLFLYDDIEACAGTLPALERFVTNSTARIGTPLPEGWRAELHVMSYETLQAQDECPSGAAGCARYGTTPRAWSASFVGEYHESMHLIGRETLGFPPPVFDEGLATNWGSTPFSRFMGRRKTIEDLLRAGGSYDSWTPSSYAPAAALTHLLLDDYGSAYFDLFATLARDASYADIESAFSTHFGDSLDSVLERLTSHSQCTEPLWVCEESEGETRVLPFAITEIDCNDDATTGFFHPAESPVSFSPYRILRFTLDADTRLEMTLTHVSVTFHACGRCDTDTGYRLGVNNELTLELDFEAGVWMVVVEPYDPYDPDGAPAFELRVAD